MNTWDTPYGAMAGANSFCALNILYLLMEKGVITQQEAAKVFTETADQVRNGTEDGAAPAIGEGVAKSMEEMAAWCLGYSSLPKP
jgi:hypothetical protein